MSKSNDNRGGRREGAGRPRKPAVLAQLAGRDPMEFLQSLIEDGELDVKIRMDAAKALMPYIYAKKGELGKKEQAALDARELSETVFKPLPPPTMN